MNLLLQIYAVIGIIISTLFCGVYLIVPEGFKSDRLTKTQFCYSYCLMLMSWPLVLLYLAYRIRSIKNGR